MKAGKDTNGQILWHCPGCGEIHAVDNRWTFNNDFEKPTLSPSVLVTKSWKKEPTACHCFIKSGKIQFLNDCAHELAGKTVEMTDWK